MRRSVRERCFGSGALALGPHTCSSMGSIGFASGRVGLSPWSLGDQILPSRKQSLGIVTTFELTRCSRNRDETSVIAASVMGDGATWTCSAAWCQENSGNSAENWWVRWVGEEFGSTHWCLSHSRMRVQEVKLNVLNSIGWTFSLM